MSADPRYPDRMLAPNLESWEQGMANLPIALKKMGFPSLREGQKGPVYNIMAERDTFCILPTAGGKTAIFVIPTLALKRRTIVFSPLVSLMRDQTNALLDKGIPVAQMSGQQSPGENASALERWAQRELSLLFMAPERLQTDLMKRALEYCPPDMIVVDEAHCLSQWAHNFRSSYCTIGDIIRDIPPKVVAAFTATCPPEAEADIRRVLGIQKAKKFVYYERRENLHLSSGYLPDDESEANAVIADRAREFDGPGIIYCSTRTRVCDVTERLQASLGVKAVSMYHGGLDNNTRRNVQDEFMEDQVRVLVATNAFGMGVDKGNVRHVLHRDLPGSVEALNQEVGRAGRDGNDSWCCTLSSKKGIETQHFFIKNGNPTTEDFEKVYNYLMRIRSRDGTIQATVNDIAFGAMGAAFAPQTMRTGAVLQGMLGAKVLDNAKSDIKEAKFQVKGSDENHRFVSFCSHLKQGGIIDPKSKMYAVDLVWMAGRLNVTESTLRGWIRDWEKNELIEYRAPFKGKTRKLIGELELIDFDSFEMKREQALEKFKYVEDYIDTPDEDKHAFFEEYFKVERVFTSTVSDAGTAE